MGHPGDVGFVKDILVTEDIAGQGMEALKEKFHVVFEPHLLEDPRKADGDDCRIQGSHREEPDEGYLFNDRRCVPASGHRSGRRGA